MRTYTKRNSVVARAKYTVRYNGTVTILPRELKMQYVVKAVKRDTGETEYLKVDAESEEGVYSMLSEDGYLVESAKPAPEEKLSAPTPPPLPPPPKSPIGDLAEHSGRQRTKTVTKSHFPGWLLGTQITIAVLLLTGTIFALISMLPADPTGPTKWEYLIETPSDYTLDLKLDEYGRDGWELIFARRASSGAGGSYSYEMIFKRPKQLTD